MNWQSTMPRFRDDPDVVHKRFRVIFRSYYPNWEDVGQLLECLLCTEEKERVLRGAREAAEAGSDGRDFITLVNPTQWNPNNPAHMRDLKKFLDYILTGIKQAGERTLDWSKVHNTVQGKEEHPSDFYERLCKAFCIYTNIDPKATDTQSTVRFIFISQSAPDIKKRLQRLEGAEGKSLEELVSVATRVYHTREKIQETKQVRLLAALVNAGNGNEKQGGWRGPPGGNKNGSGGRPRVAPMICVTIVSSSVTGRGSVQTDVPGDSPAAHTNRSNRWLWKEETPLRARNDGDQGVLLSPIQTILLLMFVPPTTPRFI
ncbi:polyprotein [Chelydra serpentina]|uniref:Polyprotein n=1 Tax=Chelydra serpentina TaxID=8475 RepID=A0A8T1SGR0_CHESE|nr:polyprotein [Chelydra serpentina]